MLVFKSSAKLQSLRGMEEGRGEGEEKKGGGVVNWNIERGGRKEEGKKILLFSH